MNVCIYLCVYAYMYTSELASTYIYKETYSVLLTTTYSQVILGKLH